MRRIMDIEENVIYRWIASSQISTTLHIVRKIVTSLPPQTFSKTLAYFVARFQDID